MNIQDSPKQIALTTEQINGIKNKYTSMVPEVKEEPVVAAPTPEPEPTPEPNIFDAPVMESAPAPSVEPAPAVEPVQKPAPVVAPTEAVVQEAPANAAPEAPIEEVQNENQNIFDQSASPEPTNAEIIGGNENVFDTTNVFDNANSAASPQMDASPVVENIFNEPALVNNEIVNSAPVVNTTNEIDALKGEYEQIVNAAANLNNMVTEFGKKLAAYGMNNNEIVNQNVTPEVTNNQTLHM